MLSGPKLSVVMYMGRPMFEVARGPAESGRTISFCGVSCGAQHRRSSRIKLMPNAVSPEQRNYGTRAGMSLSLLQGYSSPEEEADDGAGLLRNSSDDEDGDESGRAVRSYSALPHSTRPSGASGLPSAFDAFSEISGPPEFLNNAVQEEPSRADSDQQMLRHGRRRNRRDKKDLPAGAVVEAKAQLVGIHERVRSDIEGGAGTQPSAPSIPTEGKRVSTATNPNAEDAAELLRICLQCGVPKTYTNARGMVCPMCGDRPRTETISEPKKKGSTIKDKEKSKRMKGQSSHATWKSETEMQLRQQFD